MKKIISNLLILTLIISIVMPLAPVYAEDNNNASSEENTISVDKTDENEFDSEKFSRDLGLLKIIANYVMNDYLYPVDQDELTDNIYKSFFDTLDKYSVYYTPEEYSNFTTDLAGEFGGVGVQMTKGDSGIYVVEVLEGTPAEGVGLKANDIFTKVEGEDVTEFTLDDLAGVLRGEIGTDVNIEVKRNNKYIDFVIKRAAITVSSISDEIINEDIGYIKISQFNVNSDEQFKEILDRFDEAGISKLIVDVRNNPGGEVGAVLNIANNFVSEKPLLIQQNADGNETTYVATATDKKYDLVVLVNANSASASEILAGAIQDNEAGIIIGQTTYGKGVVQRTLKLSDGSGLKYTCAQYFTPNKNTVQGLGITPNIEVEQELLHADVDLEDIPELKGKRDATMNDVGLDVLGAEMILKILGYNIESVDGVLDSNTYYRIAEFQKDNGIYARGILDKETQAKLTEKLNSFVAIEKDNQLDRAIEELSE